MKFLRRFLRYPGFDLEKKLGYTFSNGSLLEKALTHKSTAGESAESYERLEFLGDSVLQLVVSEYLFKKFPENNEGKLSLYRSAIVSKKNLSRISEELGLVSFLKVSESVDMHNVSTAVNISSSLLESVIGAIYVDGGLKPASRFILKYIIKGTDIPEIVSSFNYKGRLLEFCQRYGMGKPKFTTSSYGPDHDKTFLCTITLNKKPVGTGRGKSKRNAEESASRDALEKLCVLEKKGKC